MNKIYIFIPMLGVAMFAGFYMNFSKNHEAGLAAIEAKAEVERKGKAHRDVAAREQAIKAAIEAQEKRKLEREERDRLEEAKKVARQEAEDRRQRAFDDRKRTREQLDRLKKDVEAVNAEIAKLETLRQAHLDEQAFLRNYVKQAEANVKYYYTLLDKLVAAEAAKAAAAAAEAAGKKS